MPSLAAVLTASVVLAATALPRGCDWIVPPEPGPGPGPQEPNPVAWKTPTVALTADDFYLVVDGQRFDGRGARFDVHSDPGWNEYTTLEVTWFERGKELRIYIYFEADANKWWSDEIRTYDGKSPAEWLYYLGHFFDLPRGQPFTGNLTLNNNGPDDRYRGVITFKNLKLVPSFTSDQRPR